jgi:purine-binding chemotaxis protein CheW
LGAKKMNKEMENTIVKEEIVQLVTFCLGEEEFGFDIFKVKEINKMMDLIKVPNSPHYVEGVVNLRSKIIPVIDLRTRLDMEKKEYDTETRIIVVDLHERTVGFIVDEVKEVLRISKNITEAPPDIVLGVDAEYITSIAKLEDRLLILLDLTKILSSVEMGKVTL